MVDKRGYKDKKGLVLQDLAYRNPELTAEDWVCKETHHYTDGPQWYYTTTSTTHPTVAFNYSDLGAGGSK